MISNSRIRSLRAKFSGDHMVTVTITDHNQVFVFNFDYATEVENPEDALNVKSSSEVEKGAE